MLKIIGAWNFYTTTHGKERKHTFCLAKVCVGKWWWPAVPEVRRSKRHLLFTELTSEHICVFVCVDWSKAKTCIYCIHCELPRWFAEACWEDPARSFRVIMKKQMTRKGVCYDVKRLVTPQLSRVSVKDNHKAHIPELTAYLLFHHAAQKSSRVRFIKIKNKKKTVMVMMEVTLKITTKKKKKQASSEQSGHECTNPHSKVVHPSSEKVSAALGLYKTWRTCA